MRNSVDRLSASKTTLAAHSSLRWPNVAANKNSMLTQSPCLGNAHDYALGIACAHSALRWLRADAQQKQHANIITLLSRKPRMHTRMAAHSAARRPRADANNAIARLRKAHDLALGAH